MTRSASQTASYMMSSTGASSNGFVNGLRQNPLPAALIGIGAAWMLMNGRSMRYPEADYQARYRYGVDVDDRTRRARDFAAGYEREDLEHHGSEYGADYSRTGYPRTTSSTVDYADDRSMGSGFVDRVKNNPIPAALAGLGLGWLDFSSTDRADTWAYDEWPTRAEWRDPSDADPNASTLAQVKDTVSDAASGVTDQAKQLGAKAQAYARDTTQRARYTGRRAQSQLERMTRENPLAVGAGALLLGAAVGLALPETECENEWLGETRDNMLDKSQDLARTAATRAQETASYLAGEAAKRIVGGKTE